MGTLAIGTANRQGFLIANTNVQGQAEEVSCDTKIVPWLYSMDVAVPILSFNEEKICRLRQPNKSDLAVFSIPQSVGPTTDTKKLVELKAADIWRWGKGAYALLGWGITSLVLLTVTGVFRRAAED